MVVVEVSATVVDGVTTREEGVVEVVELVGVGWVEVEPVESTGEAVHAVSVSPTNTARRITLTVRTLGGTLEVERALMSTDMKWLRRAFYLVLALVVVVGVWGFYLSRRSFPTVEGEITVAGLEAPVEVIRDAWGIPHIYAANAHDLFFAQGYTHAQERFWQMDFWRHVGSARLSEMFGSGQVEADMFLRSLRLVESTEEELAQMHSSAREILQWYADGVNAYLSEHDGAEVSLEYGILALTNPSYEIEPWTPINTLTWAKMMSWDLSGNMRTEIMRAVLSSDLSPERIAQLFPPFPPEHPVIAPEDQSVDAGSDAIAEIPSAAIPALIEAGQRAESVYALTGGGFEGIGSNNWVIGGGLTESGMPILANDPHLPIQMPSIWTPIGLHCTAECDFQLVGFSFAGVPGVVIGHNDRIAWGVTNQAVDTQDLFIERVNPDNPDEYEVNGEWVPFDVQTEVIKVAGGDDVTFESRWTRHGPVISGTFLEEGELDGATSVDLPAEYVVALSWQSLYRSSIAEAVINLNLASNYEEFRVALSFWDIASQNVVYADVDGNIAYQATGEIPIRASGDGSIPVPGWTSEYDWIGLVPYDALPRMLNPPRDYVATANQPVLEPGHLPFFGVEAAYGYRGQRIEEMIAATSGHTVASSQAMQLDSRDGGAAIVVPFLLALDAGDDPVIMEVQSILSAWSTGEEAYQARADSTGAAVYNAVWRQLLANTFHDDLPEDYWPVGGGRFFQLVKGLLESADDPYWDDTRTDGIETRDQILRQSILDGYAELTALAGSDSSRWSWGGIHIARFVNQTLGKSGIPPIEWLFNRTAPRRVGGGTAIVNAVGWDASESFEAAGIPSMRMVIDMSDFSNSFFVNATGTSGHAFHPHYDDMIALWADGGYVPMHWDRDALSAEAVSTLTMVPGQP
ncbi:MAG: penicillin acylase family protein [Acidimicrobiia bacterium]|nr:penicillin acylase family protein [Acidimicrobiia bacterium]